MLKPLAEFSVFSIRLIVLWAMGAMSLAQAVPEKCAGPLALVGQYEVTRHFFKKDNALSPKEEKQVDEQARAAWEFLREYHQAVGENPNALLGIKGVEIRPITEAPHKRPFSVQDGKVILGMKKSLVFRTPKVMLPSQIRDHWENGDQFRRRSLFKQDPIKKLWRYISPTGTTRQNLRKVMLKLKDDVAERVSTANHSTLKTMAAGLLDGKPEKELEKIRKRWIEELKNPKIVDHLANVATQKILADQVPDYKLRYEGDWVTVGNIHDIHVAIKTGEEDLIQSERPKVDVELKGAKVTVFTIDRINIEINLSGAFEKATLRKVLDKIP